MCGGHCCDCYGEKQSPSYFVGFAQKPLTQNCPQIRQCKQNPYLSLVDRDYEHFVFSVQFKKRQTDRQNQWLKPGIKTLVRNTTHT